MLRIFFWACVILAGSALTCQWMESDFQRYTEGSLALLETMRINSTNSTDDVELPDDAAFPNDLYSRASKARRPKRLRVAAQIFNEITRLFKEDHARASWSNVAVKDFLNVVAQLADKLRACAVKHHHHHHHHLHGKIYEELTSYFQRLSRALREMDHSAEAWELILGEIRLHISRAHVLAAS